MTARAWLANITASSLLVGWCMVYPHLREELGSSHASLSFAQGCLFAITSVFGPFARHLSKLYGDKIITFIGVIFAFIGIGLCSIHISNLVIYICYGGLCGSCQAMILPHCLMTNHNSQSWLKNHSFMAMFLGSIFLPFLFDYILTYYQFKVIFWAWSGFLCSMAVVYAIYMLIGFLIEKSVMFMNSEKWKRRNKNKEVYEFEDKIFIVPKLNENKQSEQNACDNTAPFKESPKMKRNSFPLNGETNEHLPENIVHESVNPGAFYESSRFHTADFSSIESMLTARSSESISDPTYYSCDDNDNDEINSLYSCASISTEFNDQGDRLLDALNLRQWKNPLSDPNNIYETNMSRSKSMVPDRNLEILPEIPEEFEEESDHKYSPFINWKKHTSLVSLKSNDSFLTVKSDSSNEPMYSCTDLIELTLKSISNNQVEDTFTDVSSFQTNDISCMEIEEYNIPRQIPLRHTFTNCNGTVGKSDSKRKSGGTISLVYKKSYKIILQKSLYVSIAVAWITSTQVFLLYLQFASTLGQIQLNNSSYIVVSMFISKLLAMGLTKMINDTGILHQRYYEIVAGILGSVAAISTSFAWNAVTFYLSVIGFGFASGIETFIYSLVIQDLIKLHDLTHLFNIIHFLNGFISLISYPAFGHLMDVYGRQNGCYLVYLLLGIISFLNPILWIVITIFNKPKRKLRRP